MRGPSLALVINLIRELRAFVRSDPDATAIAWIVALSAAAWAFAGLFH